MDEKPRRRAVLSGLAAGLVGMSGCTSLDVDATGKPDSPTTPGSTRHDEDTPTGTEQAATSWGPTIPTYPYRETGSDPLRAEPDPDVLNPVLTSGHVTDVDAEFVADPFLFVENDEWHMFFEVLAGRGMIGHARGEKSGTVWTYDRIVLEREFHLSFPQVFKWKGEYYMTTQEKLPLVRLYRATEFPTEWTEVDRLYNPSHFGLSTTSDHALFRRNGRWWSIAGGSKSGAKGNTYLFYSDSLTGGDWKPHADNPVVENRPRASRPAGRPIVRDDNVLVFYQDIEQYYGRQVRAYRITDLSPDSFADHEVEASPVLEPTGDGGGWNSHRMHHYDPWHLGDGDGWRVAVDGDDSGNDWAIGIYRVK